MKIFKFIPLLYFFNTIKAEEKEQKEEIILENKNNFDKKKFALFLKKLNGNKLKCFLNRYFCYINKNVMYIFDTETKTIKRVLFNFDKKIEIEAFLFDGKSIYLIIEKSLINYDLEGNKIKENKDCFKTSVYEIDVYNEIILVFGHSNEIFAFVDFKENLNLIWFFNDINASIPYDFSYKFHDDKIFISHNNRVCVVDLFNGEVVKNYYLEKSYNNISIINNNILLYDTLQNCTINLKDNKIRYLEEFKIGENVYKVNNKNKIVKSEKTFNVSYLNHLFFEDSFIAYSSNSLSSEVLIINKEEKEKELYFRYFVLSNIFYVNGKYILVDEKFGRFKVI